MGKPQPPVRPYIPNPYLEQASQFLDRWNNWDERTRLVAEYSWAVPDQRALCAILDTVDQFGLKGVVEMGAGSGYWGSLLRALAGNWVGLDRDPWVKTHAPVQQAETGALADSRWNDWMLFLCWPPYATDMGINAIKAFKGKYLAYVGEGKYGCTGCDDMHEELDTNWMVLDEISIPQWNGIHDYLTLYVRKE